MQPMHLVLVSTDPRLKPRIDAKSWRRIRAALQRDATSGGCFVGAQLTGLTVVPVPPKGLDPRAVLRKLAEGFGKGGQPVLLALHGPGWGDTPPWDIPSQDEPFIPGVPRRPIFKGMAIPGVWVIPLTPDPEPEVPTIPGLVIGEALDLFSILRGLDIQIDPDEGGMYTGTTGSDGMQQVDPLVALATLSAPGSGPPLGQVVLARGASLNDRFTGYTDSWGWSGEPWPERFELTLEAEVGEAQPLSFQQWPDHAFSPSQARQVNAPASRRYRILRRQPGVDPVIAWMLLREGPAGLQQIWYAREDRLGNTRRLQLAAGDTWRFERADEDLLDGPDIREADLGTAVMI